MAALDDARSFYFGFAMTFARMLLQPDVVPNAIEATKTALAALTAQPDQRLALSIESALVSERDDFSSRRARAKVLLDQARAWYLTELDSPYVDGGVITDPAKAFVEINGDLVLIDKYVAARDVVYASDPTAADGILLERLVTDHLGQEIQGGRHNETVSAKVTKAPLTGAGVGRGQVTIYGSSGSEDDLDYRGGGTARAANVVLDILGNESPGLINNSAFNPAAGTLNGATIDEDNLDGWGISGAATLVWDTSIVWRTKTGSVKVSGNGQTATFVQDLVLPGDVGEFDPLSGLGVFTPDAGFTGSITLTIGNLVKTVAHGAMSLGALNYIKFDADEYRYIKNLDDGAVQAELEIVITTGFVNVHFFDAQKMKPRQGNYFAAWFHTANPTVGLVKEWVDSCTYEGKINDVVAVAEDEAPYAYHASSGTTPINFAPFQPEIEVELDGSPIQDAGTTTLLDGPAGAVPITVRITNSGAGVLAVGVPTSSSPTNASLTGAGLTTPVSILPGEFVEFDIEITTAAPGAASLDVTFPNNDADEPAFTVTINGTAV